MLILVSRGSLPITYNVSKLRQMGNCQPATSNRQQRLAAEVIVDAVKFKNILPCSRLLSKKGSIMALNVRTESGLLKWKFLQATVLR